VHDYFLKDNLGPRLIVAIERELREAAIRAERRRMHEQLLISDRMVSMGTLAAGVAHEINNPLASVMANLDLAARELAELGEKLSIGAELSEVREELRDARDAAERIRNIVRDLKIFSRSEEGSKGLVDIHRVMESTLRMAWNEVRHRARLVKMYGATPRVEASDSRLGQVFLNLIINAAQAIAEGDAEHNEIRITTSTDERGWAIVEVADTGPGMGPEVRGLLFTPFFTTKPVLVGTGLGLSICQRIVSDLGGSIDVESELGRGTRFRVSIPGAPPRPSEPDTAVAARATPAPRRGRVLVVDDERMVTKALSRILSTDHTVVLATSAADALARLAAGEEYDVILCDLMMPQMTGMDLYDELLRVAPQVVSRIVFLTGGAFTHRARKFLDAIPNQRIEKPFDSMHLRSLINDRVRASEGRS
jgi:signal transduction histidine kinase/CheY-like chemotaxis protein